MKQRDIRLSMLDIQEGISIDMYVGVFPERLVDEIFKKAGDEKVENLALGRLNIVIKGILPDCYTNYVNKRNIQDGWVYSYSSENIDLIRHFLFSWAKEYDLEDDVIKECIDDFKFEKTVIYISLEDLKKPNYLKKNLFLFHISRLLTNGLKYSITLNNGHTSELSFSFVNELNKSCKYRLMSDVIESNIIKRGKPSENNVYYSYYVDLSIDTLFGQDKPNLIINTGLVRFRTTPSKFKTKKKNIHPYILVANSNIHSKCKRNYLKGKIICKNDKFVKDFNPHWDWFFKECFSYTYEKLPSVEDIFTNPEFMIKENNIKVLIPHGTHFKDAKHDILQGADVVLRANLISSVKDVLSSELFNNFKNEFVSISMQEEKTQGGNSARILENPIVPTNANGELELEVYYLHEEFKDIFQQFVDKYNSGELNMKVPKRKDFSKDDAKLLTKLLKNKNNPIVVATQDLLSQLQNKDVEKNCKVKIPEELKISELESFINSLSGTVVVKYKINVKYYSLLDDLGISSEILDGYSLAKNKASKEKALSEISIALSKNSRMITKNIKKSNSVVPAIVEIMDKKYYVSKKLVDLKPSLRSHFAKNNRTTQFLVDALKKDKNGDVVSSTYNKISKCILECLRAMGVMTVDIDEPLKKHNSNDESAIIGIYGIPASESFILTSIFKGQVYGYMAGISTKWTPIGEFLSDIGSKVECKSEYNQDIIEIAIRKFKDEYNPNHIILVANRTTLKSKIPYFVKMENDFNLCVKHKEDENFNPIAMDRTLSDTISVVSVDEESGGLCPEWVVREDGEEVPTSLVGRFCRLSDEIYFGIAPKTNTSNMKVLVNKTKEEALDDIMRKETAILYSIPKVHPLYDKEFIVRLVHSLREKASIQSMAESTVYPYPLHLAKKSSEYVFKKIDLIYSSEDIEDMSIEDEEIILSADLKDIEYDEEAINEEFIHMANMLIL